MDASVWIALIILLLFGVCNLVNLVLLFVIDDRLSTLLSFISKNCPFMRGGDF